MKKVVKSRADGVILFNNEFLDEQINQISKDKIPIVVVGDYLSGKGLGSIHTNIKEGITTIVSSYLQKGTNDILFVTTHQNLISETALINGIQDAYGKMQFNQIIETSTDYDESYQQFNDYFKTNRHQLVIATNDKQAVAVINAAIENGIKIPEEMEVIGMFNTSYALMSKPRLTSIYIPIYNMGALAVRLFS